MLATILLILFGAGLIFAALHDVTTMTIPNWVSIAIVLLFPLAGLAAGLSWLEIGMSVLAGFIALLICFALFSIGIFGGGDAKLLPAVFVWIGMPAWLHYIYGIAIIGGLLSLLILVTRKLAPKEAVPGFLQRSVVEGPGIPYAVAIAAGAIWAAPHSPVLFSLLSQSGLSH